MEPTGSAAPVIRLEWPAKTLAVVSMEDRASRNSFTPPFIEGITTAFREISASTEARVVVVHGFGNFFCCGGTKQELLRLAEGKAQFTDLPFYDVLMRCEIPVIAAMDGHAIGAGLVFGCYADLIFLAEEAVYCTNFMRFGFTPGMGATCIVPRRFGQTLGWEMLMTGRTYRGGELRGRGAPMVVAPKADLFRLALEQARELAETPTLALKELKRCQVDSMRDELQAAIRKELAMHRVTFSQPEVHKRILTMIEGDS